MSIIILIGKGLKCGRSNCAQFRPDNYARADCCYDPKYSYTGKGNYTVLHISVMFYLSDLIFLLQLLAGLTVASAKTEKRSQRRISATTVCARMGKSRAPYWIAPTVSQS